MRLASFVLWNVACIELLRYEARLDTSAVVLVVVCMIFWNVACLLSGLYHGFVRYKARMAKSPAATMPQNPSAR